jgi:hypothetical protein
MELFVVTVLVVSAAIVVLGGRYILEGESKRVKLYHALSDARKQEQEKRRLIDENNYNRWLQEMPAKLSQGGFSSLGGKDRDELFLIYQLLMNGGELNQTQKRLLEIALADPATSKFLELRGSQGNMPSPTTSLSPQMTGAFSALGIAGAAGIMQRGQIRQELNEVNENLADNGGGDAGGGGEAGGDFGGFM